MPALPLVNELFPGQSMQIATPEGRWYSATGINPTNAGGAFIPIFITAPYTQPADISGTVDVSVNSVVGVAPGDFLFVRNGGYYAIVSVLGPFQVRLRNLGLSTSVAALTVVGAGEPVTLTGPPSDPNYFDVRLFGATPTDVGPGISAALAAATANHTGTVYVPPLLNGQPWGMLTAVTFNAAFGTGDLIVKGSGTWIRDAGIGPFNAFLTLSTLSGVMTVDGFIFSGIPGGGLVTAIGMSSCEKGVVGNCIFAGVQALGFGNVVGFTAVQEIVMYNCLFGASGTTGANTGTVRVSGGCQVCNIENVFFWDFPPSVYSANSPIATTAHIYISTADEVDINNCFFDEVAVNDVWVDAAAGGVGNVRIQSCYSNPPTLGQPVKIDTCKSVTVDSLTLASTGVLTSVAFDVRACGSFTIRNTNAPSKNQGPTEVLLRSGNGVVRLVDSPGFALDTHLATPAQGIWQTVQGEAFQLNSPSGAIEAMARFDIGLSFAASAQVTGAGATYAPVTPGHQLNLTIDGVAVTVTFTGAENNQATFLATLNAASQLLQANPSGGQIQLVALPHQNVSTGAILASAADVLASLGLAVGAFSTATIANVVDQSGVNDPTHDLAASVAPLLNAQSAAFDNRPTLSFTGTESLPSAVWSVPQAQPFTVVVIGKQITAATVFAFDNQTASVNHVAIEGVAAETSIHLDAGSNVSWPTDTSKPALYIAEFSGATSDVAIESAAPQFPQNAGGNALTGVTLGNAIGGVGSAGWEIAEYRVYAGKLTLEAREALCFYAQSVYGIVELGILATQVPYVAANPADWSGNPPSNVSTALDRIAAKITPIP